MKQFYSSVVCFLLVFTELQSTPITHEQAVRITDQIEELLESSAADEIIQAVQQMMREAHAQNGTDFWMKQLAFRMKNIQKKLDQVGAGLLEETLNRLETTTETPKEEQNKEPAVNQKKKMRVWRKPLRDFGQLRASLRKKETYDKLTITEKQI
uniref:Methionyl-tRNA formyltransferase n=2 Tax=Lygus hesperus TaxID=30085 RepID=A0A0A9XPX6_LYGHE